MNRDVLVFPELDSLKGLQNKFIQILYYATLFYIPFYRWRSIGPIKIHWVLTGIFGFIGILYLITQKRIPPFVVKSKVLPLFFLFLIINIICSLISPYSRDAFDGVMLLVLDILFILINLTMINIEGFFKIVPMIVIYSVSINNILAILGYYFHVQYFVFEGRGVGATIDPNNASIMTVFIVPLIITRMFYSKREKELFLYFILFFINVLGIIATESRAGFLVFSIITLISFWENRKKFHPRYLGLLIGISGITLLTIISMVPQAYVARLAKIKAGPSGDVSLERRATYLVVAKRAIKEKPFLGWGTLTFKDIWYNSEESLRFAHVKRPAHNTYIEVTVGTGFVGLFLFVLILLRALKNYNYAIRKFQKFGESHYLSTIKGYRLGFIGILIYFFFKSAIEHKMFLLALPLSDIAYVLANEYITYLQHKEE